jgi:hypothetical protein
MFSFDAIKGTVPIAIIRDGKLKNEVIHMKRDPNIELKRGEFHDAIELTQDMGTLEVIPNADKDQRDLLYICGKSGSGKSVFTRSYVKNYLRANPSHKCYIFSQVESDKAFDDLKRCYRVIIDSEIINEENGTCNIGTEELKNSLVVLDDIDTIGSKKILNAIYELENRILETGRHFNIYMCRTSHLITKGHKSRTVLNEASKVVLFLNGCPSGSTRNYLRSHHGMNNKQINKLYNIKSRWIMINNNFPSYILSQYGVYNTNHLDDNEKY